MSGNRQSLLFFTNSEWGQANVILATIHEFLIRDEYDIHLASYSPLKKRTQELFKTHARSYPESFSVVFQDEKLELAQKDVMHRPSLTFHTIPGLSIAETCHRDGIAHELPHVPGTKGAVASYRRLAEFFIRYTIDEYMAAERCAKEVILRVNPMLVLVEQGFSPGIDACNELEKGFTILSPNSFKDFEQYLQPKLGVLWKYPALSSAFPYPLPWNLVPVNIYLWLRMLVVIAGTALDKKSRLASNTKGRHEHGLKGPLPVVDAYKKAAAIICPSLPDLDFPMHVRPTTTGCGPIVLPAQSVAELDPELATWLAATDKRTVLVNLGTHYSMDLDLAMEVAHALLDVLDRFPDIQILWKIMLRSDQQAEVQAIFGQHVASGRIRMQAWLKPDPVALFETGRIAAQVHHGGANTYFECCRAGVPQVVLAAWWDTYEYAARVEYLGIGVFANKQSAPRARTSELESTLNSVINNEEMRAKAEELAAVCRQHGEGRVVAHDQIVHLAHLASRDKT